MGPALGGRSDHRPRLRSWGVGKNRCHSARRIGSTVRRPVVAIALMGVEADHGDPGSRNPQWSGTALWTGCGHCQDKQRKLLIGKGAPGSAQKTGNRVPASGAGWKTRWDRHPAASRLLSPPSVFQNRGGGISTEAALCIEPARQGDGAPRQCTFVGSEADRGRPDPRNPQQIGTVLWTGCGHPQEKQLKWLIQKGVRGSA